MIRRLGLTATTMLLCTAVHAQSLTTAKLSARQGKADVAIAQVQQVLGTEPGNAEAHLLLCRVFGSIDQFEAAVKECENARDQQPSDSDTVLALARAYGARADHAGALTGMRMVGRIRENFEKSVQLNPRNIEALSDLGEFYVEAPGMVGGGVDKARALLPKLQALSPARAHRLAGMIAAKSGDYTLADSEFAQELAEEHSPEAYVDLANYYRKRKMWDQSAQNATLAIQKDTRHGPDTIDATRILLEEKRDLPVAQRALREYLTTAQPTGVMPAAAVHTMLGEALKETGNKAGAQEQFAAALSLAHDYAPARKVVGR